MKLSIDRAVLMKTLARAQSAVERRTTLPILSNVLLVADNGVLSVTATDTDMTISEEVACRVDTPGATTAPAHTLHDIIRKLPDGTEVKLDDENGGDRLKITARRASFALATLPRADFPLPSEPDAQVRFQLAGAELKRLIDDTRFAMSTEETRHTLNGVYLHTITGGTETPCLRGAATDGHRMARFETEMPAGAEQMAGVIMPRKTITELNKLLDHHDGDVEVEVTPTQIRFGFGITRIVSKVIDGQFPDYERVIPANNPHLMSVPAKAFARAVDRVSTITTDRTRAIKLELTQDCVTLSAVGPSTGEAREEIDASYEGADMEIGFNVRYLLDMIERIGDGEALVEMNDALSPAIIRNAADDGALYVLMPMRV